MGLIAVFLIGALFALGLGAGGMTLPGKILAFLDVAGAWDPSLVLVLGSAVVTYGIVYRLSLRRPRPLLAKSFVLPGQTGVDRRLVAGAVVFGIGWGLGGFCPGPAIVALVTAQPAVLAFVAAMAAGMLLHDRLAGMGRAPATRSGPVPASADG